MIEYIFNPKQNDVSTLTDEFHKKEDINLVFIIDMQL